MGSINSAFNIITGALDADQAALSIVAGNVANANTTGYTQETANFSETGTVTINGLTYGTGVTETGATSVRDRVLLQRLDQQQQLASSSSARLTALDTMQTLFTPSSSSSSTAGDIGTDVTNFFDSFSSLEANPTDNALRQQVLSTGSLLAGDVSNAASSLETQRSGLDEQANSVVTQINALTQSIAQLNQQIQSSSPTADAGTLEDQRQQDISNLSQLIGINQITNENNGLTITTTGGETLVAGANTFAITAQTSGGVTDFSLGGTDITSSLASGGGELGGTLQARDQDIPSVLNQLDQLAFGISTETNLQNAAGTDLNGNAGSAIFSQPTQVAGSALNMAVVMTSPDGIAAAAAGSSADSGDNSNATALANLASSAAPSILVGYTPPGATTALTAGQGILNNLTPGTYYSNMITVLGSTVSEVQTENTAQSASVTQLQTQNNAASSVNLNDQAALMTTFERSYQAASQVFTILNTIMASALNMGEQATVS